MIQFTYLRICIVFYCISITEYMYASINNYTEESIVSKCLCASDFNDSICMDLIASSNQIKPKINL